MVKFAISTDGDFVSAHFGRCPSFTLVEADNAQVTSKEVIANPGHHPGFLPEFLHKQDVTAIICGGMGQRARVLFEQKAIQAITGCEGSVDEAIDAFVKGKLESRDNPCAPRSGKGYGLDKTECDHD